MFCFNFYFFHEENKQIKNVFLQYTKLATYVILTLLYNPWS